MANKLFKKIENYEDGRDEDPKDYEGIHVMQDQIYRAFISAVASGKIVTIADARSVAKEIVKTVIADEKKFTRWYA